MQVLGVFSKKLPWGGIFHACLGDPVVRLQLEKLAR